MDERKKALEGWATHVQGLVVPWPDRLKPAVAQGET
jgi:hypothetical protein